MATLAATGALAAAGSAVNPIVGFAAMMAASYIDSRYIMPGLLGKQQDNVRQPRLLGVAVGPNEAGAPRVWAMGRRCKVPTHILWQNEKVRRSSGGNSKAGTATPQKQVFLDALVALNDRETKSIEQLVGNGKLMIRKSLNLISVVSSRMTAAEVGGKLRITMGDTFDPDLTDKFADDDYVQLRQFANTGSGNVNLGFWQVDAIVGHLASTPSYMDLMPRDGQTVAGMAANGGSAAAPAYVERVDDKLVGFGATTVLALYDAATGLYSWPTSVMFSGPFNRSPDLVFKQGQAVNLTSFTWSYDNVTYYPLSVGPGTVVSTSEDSIRVALSGVSWASTVQSIVYLADASATDIMTIEPIGPIPTTAGDLFPSTYDTDANFHSGTETQGEDAVLVASLGTGNVSAYRGVSYLALDDLRAAQFGDAMPFELSALLDIDDGLTWSEAFVLLAERGGIAREFVDAGDVTPKPFDGFYTRGAVTGVTNLMPLLIAGQVSTQERDGILAFQDIEAADVVQIENGADFSDMGATVGTSEPAEKLSFSHSAREDLPTSIGIRHQDQDNQYADGYQHFGIRNPSASDGENRQEFDFSNLVMTRREARDLCATVMRRAWINSTKVEMVLPAAYADLLENDLITFTDDDGRDFTARIIQRDIGTNFLVKIEAVVEDVDLIVSGSPIQSAAATPPSQLVTPPNLTAVVMDLPPLEDAHAYTPGLYVAACANGSGHWAGCTVYRSVDSEATWEQVGVLGAQHGIGTLDSALGPYSPAETNGSSTLTWQDTGALGYFGLTFENVGDVPFVTSDENGVAQLRNNWLAIFDTNGDYEIVGVRDIVQNDATNFTCSHLLRGLRGTWRRAATSHAAGSRVVNLTQLLQYGSALWVPSPGAVAPATVSFRFVPPGKDLADVQSVSVVATWRSVAPFDVRTLTKSIGASPFQARFTTEHWTRTNLPLGSTGPYPLDESYEEYKFTIYSPNGQQARRVFTITSRGTGASALRDKYVDYSAAAQILDGYTPSGSTTFWVDVQQVGDFGTSRSTKRLI